MHGDGVERARRAHQLRRGQLARVVHSDLTVHAKTTSIISIKDALILSSFMSKISNISAKRNARGERRLQVAAVREPAYELHSPARQHGVDACLHRGGQHGRGVVLQTVERRGRAALIPGTDTAVREPAH